MEFEHVLPLITYSDVNNEFVTFYQKEYGEVSLKDIWQKIDTSKSVNKFLKETAILKKPVGSDDFIDLIHSIYHFTFAKSEKIALASIFALYKWEREVATTHNIVDNIYLNKLFFEILIKCRNFKIHISNNDNFFTRFNKVIEGNFANDPLIKLSNSLQYLSMQFARIMNLLADSNTYIEEATQTILFLIYYQKLEVIDKIEQFDWPLSTQLIIPNISESKITLEYALVHTVNSIKSLANEMGLDGEIREILEKGPLYDEMEEFYQEVLKAAENLE